MSFMDFKFSRIQRQSLRATLAGMSLASTLLVAGSASAFRTDHGILPDGASTCDLHPAVTLAVPANATAVPDPFQGEFSNGFFHVEEIGNKLFYATDGVYQSLFLITAHGITVVDAPPSIGVNQQDFSQSVSFLDVIFSVPEAQGKSIKRLIYSHSHFDHIGAASLIQDAFPNVRIVAHRETQRQLRRSGENNLVFLPGAGTNPPPVPTVVFSRYLRLGYGSARLELHYRGPVHEPGNTFIYAPRQKVLMLVDTVFPGWSPFNDLALAEDIPEYLRAYDEVLSFDFDTFVGGHLNRLGDRDDVLEGKQYMQDMQANAIAALSDPSLFQIFGIVPQNPLGAFNIYLDQVACRCANLTLDPNTTPSGVDWLASLGAADINTVTHCWKIAEALRIDPTF